MSKMRRWLANARSTVPDAEVKVPFMLATAIWKRLQHYTEEQESTSNESAPDAEATPDFFSATVLVVRELREMANECANMCVQRQSMRKEAILITVPLPFGSEPAPDFTSFHWECLDTCGTRYDESMHNVEKVHGLWIACRLLSSSRRAYGRDACVRAPRPTVVVRCALARHIVRCAGLPHRLADRPDR